jgi:preprotein translocase subunit SecG
MSILIGFLYVLEVVVCLLLVLVVMLQKPKEGGLSTAVSGGMGEAVFGADAGNVLVRTTIVLGVIFLLNTLVLARLTSNRHSIMDNAGAPAAEQQPVPQPVPQPASQPQPAQQPGK